MHRHTERCHIRGASNTEKQFRKPGPVRAHKKPPCIFHQNPRFCITRSALMPLLPLLLIVYHLHGSHWIWHGHSSFVSPQIVSCFSFQMETGELFISFRKLLCFCTSYVVPPTLYSSLHVAVCAGAWCSACILRSRHQERKQKPYQLFQWEQRCSENSKR